MTKYFKISLCFLLFGFSSSFTIAQNGIWFWGNQCKGDGYLESINSDMQGNCYIAGLFPNDTIHFGGYTLMNSTITNFPYSSNFDAFLVKYAPNGNLVWAKQTFEKNINPNVGNGGNQSIFTDGFGNVYLSGQFVDTLFIGGNMLINEAIGPNPQSMYLAKYDMNGNLQWAKQAICAYNDTSFISSAQISCDKLGDIYVSGVFADTVYIGAYTIIGKSPMYYFHSFLAKYDSSGNVKWVKQSKYTGVHCEDVNVSNATDIFGNSFITGDIQDTVSFGSYTLMAGNNADFYLVKYDSAGNVLWARQNTEILGGSSQGSALVTDQTGNIYATGWFVGGVVFALDTLIAPPTGSFFLVKYDQNGNVIWLKQASVLDNNTWSPWSLSIDNYKHLYLSADGGYQNCKIAFGGDTLSMNDTAKYDGASVIFKLDSNGNALCSKITPAGSLGGFGCYIASDTSGNHVYFGASASTIAIFGEDTVNPLSYPSNVIQGGNFFPFAARWEECDSNVLYAGVNVVKVESEKVKVYPNPNNGQFTILFSHPADIAGSQSLLEIYNVMGEKIYSTPINLPQVGGFEINISNQPSGLYFYRAITNTGSLIGEGKLIIQK